MLVIASRDDKAEIWDALVSVLKNVQYKRYDDVGVTHPPSLG